METLDWIHNLLEENLICENYKDEVSNAKSKKDLFDIACCVDGALFLAEKENNGEGLPLEVMEREFKNFINGRYKAVYRDENGKQLYTSCMYIGVDTSIVVDTTVTVLFGCKGVVEVPADKHAILVLGYGSDISINNNAESRLVSWGKVLGRGDYKYKFIKDGREEELL